MYEFLDRGRLGVLAAGIDFFEKHFCFIENRIRHIFWFHYRPMPHDTTRYFCDPAIWKTYTKSTGSRFNLSKHRAFRSIFLI